MVSDALFNKFLTHLEKDSIDVIQDSIQVNAGFIHNRIKSELAGSMWGIAVFFNDRALIDGSVLNGTLIRAIVSMITLTLASYIFRQKIERIIERIQFIKILSAGSLITISSLFWFISLDYTSGSLTAMFGSTSPIFAIIFGYFFLKEKIYKLEYLSILLAFVGIVIIIFFKS